MTDLKWIRTKGSETGACAEAAFVGDHVMLRSSELPSAVITLTRAEWEQLRTGDFGEQS